MRTRQGKADVNGEGGEERAVVARRLLKRVQQALIAVCRQSSQDRFAIGKVAIERPVIDAHRTCHRAHGDGIRALAFQKSKGGVERRTAHLDLSSGIEGGRKEAVYLSRMS